MSLFIRRIQQDLDQLTSAYDRDFAGQSRSSRDLATLDELVKKTKDILARIDTIPAAAQGKELAELRDTATNNLAMYETERGEIVRAKAAGPTDQEFGNLARSANMVFARYRRHYAGKGRGSRDLSLLTEMIDDLVAIKARMNEVIKKKGTTGMKSDLEVVTNNLDMYKREQGEISRAKADGSAEDRANNLAAEANELFEVYRVHFAGHPRVTCRPKLLGRLVDTLKDVRARMDKIKQGGFTQQFNDDNLGIVDGNLEMYEAEINEVKRAREGVALVDIMSALGNAANTVFQQYRDNFAGKDRTGVDQELISRMCDRLGELGRQMAELSRVEKNEVNENNQEIVGTQLQMYEKEYDQIRQAKGLGQALSGRRPGTRPPGGEPAFRRRRGARWRSPSDGTLASTGVRGREEARYRPR